MGLIDHEIQAGFGQKRDHFALQFARSQCAGKELC
jgi:hypothetical protein